MAVGAFDPHYDEPTKGTTPFLPGFTGIPRIPGESLQDYQLRLQAAQAPYQQANAEGNQIRKLGVDQEAGSRKILGEQETVQKQRLMDLADLLSKQTDQQFNRDIPGIANTAQGQGFLETSGFGNALSRDYTNLKQDQNNQILKQGLTDRDLTIKTLGDINTNNEGLGTGALQRQFSVTDNAKAEALARELGKLGVSAPATKPSTTDQILQNAGPIMSGVAAVKGA